MASIKFKVDSLLIKTTELVNGNLAVVGKTLTLDKNLYYAVDKIDKTDRGCDIFFDNGDVAYEIDCSSFFSFPQEIKPPAPQAKPCGCH
jgi:hypothetical protein